MRPQISAIIPIFNEQNVIKNCLESLAAQTYSHFEVIAVDDGSNDQTLEILLNYNNPKFKLTVLKQNHKGPGSARNLGASKASGKILVFVDADMTFDQDFINDLTEPIRKGKTIGTFSKNEMVENSQNVWSICWNINRNLPPNRMIPEDYPALAPVFRAILKKEFDKVDGFDKTGQYSDDWSLSRKLNINSTVTNALYYHSNPANLKEIWKQARWIGKGEFISGNLLRRITSLIQYSFPVSFVIGIYKSVVSGQLLFVIFKIIYDLAIFNSTINSFIGESKSK